MNVARHHAEWLSLVETSGPFLSLPVLLRVFPQGLDRRDADRAARLREAYEDWLERGAKVTAVHHAWIRCVLRDLLEYPDDLLAEGQAIPPGIEATMAVFGETLRPDLVLKHPDASKKPVLLVGLYEPGQDLEKPVSGKSWKATAGTRMMELLHAADVPLGLLTNGEQWILVSARRGETTGFASWYADLWAQEPLTLRAFHSILHLRRLVGVAEADTLPALFGESSKDQQEVTDQLGYQVRQAVEVLIQAFDRVDAESGRTLLDGMSEKTLYDCALTVMMRLVFLFSAEERGLLLLGDPLYDQNYAVSTLSELLRERADQHGEEVLERRHDAWCRLLSTFRAVHGGVEHEAMRLPAYGGSLFDPDRFPFLEGRVEGTSWQQIPATPLLINNRVVLHLLEALQLLRVKVPGGGPSEARRLSFRALDIEQIGHVYEGLLDHTAKRASEPILGLDGSKDKQPEIPLEQLEEFAQKSISALVEFLAAETGRSEKALQRLVQEPSAADAHSLLIACGQDERLAHRVKPFAALLREDSFERLVVIPPGSVYVTSGNDRRSTGTHYTPRSLTEPIVKHTLEPLVYVGPAEGLPDTEWSLKTPKEILGLKVCDMAMGSGAFLVEACRYLAERLVEAWENAEREHPGSFIVTPDGELSVGAPTERLIPLDSAERVAIARRYLADRCLYGVDINPMAVEMAKLSLWLITLQRDRPFTFLDHALKCGDSLLGVNSLTQIERFSLRPGEWQATFATANLSRQLEEASAKRRALESLPSNDHTQIGSKHRLHAEAETATATVKGLADLLIAFELRGLVGDAYERQRTVAAHGAEAALHEPLEELRAFADRQLDGRRTFHWPLEFPEVFRNGGFDCFTGNPPFVGGKRISTFFGESYAQALGLTVPESNPNADLSVKFHLRAFRLLQPTSTYGLLATDRIAEGDTKRGGLDQVVVLGGAIYRATNSMSWPGDASVRYSAVHVFKGHYSGTHFLDDEEVPAINAALAASDGRQGEPDILTPSWGTSYVGCAIQGAGFILEEAEAKELLENDRNAEVVRPFLIANDLNHVPDQQPRRWVINFDDRDMAAASAFAECFEIIRARVKPHRDTVNRKAHRERWWQFGDRRPGLVNACSAHTHVIACAMTTVDFKFAWVPSTWVFDQTVVVIVPLQRECYTVLETSIHKSWAYEFGSGFGSGGAPRYNPSRCFETFPFPSAVTPEGRSNLARLGDTYHECRAGIMLARQEGLTATYSRFHDPAKEDDDIGGLRSLQAEIDNAVAVAYGWKDVNLGHGFHDTKHGVRYTICEPARRTLVERLLALNHQQHAEEVKAGVLKSGTKTQKIGRSSGSTSLRRGLLG